MHLGNVYAALLSYASVKAQGGRWLLRIEDLDRQRCLLQYAEQIIDDLHWLGLDADEGPYYQSQRDDFYREAFDRLQSQGCLYPCYCSRADLTAASAPHAADGHTIYARTCLSLTPERLGELSRLRKPAWRFRLPDGNSEFCDGHYGLSRSLMGCGPGTDRGDCILRRADGNFAYNLAVVVDDALMGVTEVVRARDLLEATHEQRAIAQALGYALPSTAHFPLLLAPDGARLSKRDRALHMGRIREKLRPEELIGLIAQLAGLQPTWRPMTLKSFVENFDWRKIPLADVTVDAAQLF